MWTIKDSMHKYSGQYGPIEMDEKTVQEAAKEQNLQDQVAGIAKEDDICFGQVFKLSLEYRGENNHK